MKNLGGLVGKKFTKFRKHNGCCVNVANNIDFVNLIPV